MKRHLNPLAIVAFTSGFALMAFELVAARILAPSIGSSTYVWTSVIGVIMIALSAGYYLGGKLADKRHRDFDVGVLSFIAAGLVAIVLFTYPFILQMVVETGGDRRWQAFWAALLLFAPASVVLGMLSPYLTKLNITSLATSGQSVATLSVMNSIGSIAGTFIAGFILFSFIGSRETLAVVILLLVATAWVLAPKERIIQKLIATAILIAIAIAGVYPQAHRSIDTPSASYQIHNYVGADGRELRGIVSGPGGIQSGVFISAPDELAFWYTNELVNVVDAAPNKGSILMLGGGTYTIPRALASKYPNSKIDVVEIDPGLTEIAREHFSYNDPGNITLHYDDARAFINQAPADTYDIILVDVYSDASVPFSLLTQEYGEGVAKTLRSDGVVAVNAIAASTGSCRPLYDAVNRAHAPVSSVYYAKQQLQGARSNMILVYSNALMDLSGYTKGRHGGTPVYTDNFMPAESLQQQCAQA